SGATLMGTGIVGALSIASGGTVAPGNNGIGTLNVAGGVTFASGSIYQVEATASGQADKIMAGGIATINGGTVQVLASGTFTTTMQYTILTASSRTGTFDSVTSNF